MGHPSFSDTADRAGPWVQRDGVFGQGSGVPIEQNRRYSLAELIDIAQRNNPETRVAWEQARRAALAVGLDESEYAPQVSIDVIGGYQRTPLPMPDTVVPAGYFISDSREIFPVLALKWLLFDFGRREGQDQAARANSFVANVAFTGVHQKLVYTVSRAYFSLGAARGRLSSARRALTAAETVQDAAVSRRERGLATVVVPAQAQRQTAQARYYLTKATGDERTAYANLIASLGVAADARIDIIDSSQQQLPAEPPEDMDAVLRDALTHRPDVIAAIGKIEAAEGALKSRRADYYPKDWAQRPEIYREHRRLQYRWRPLVDCEQTRRQHSVTSRASLCTMEEGATPALPRRNPRSRRPATASPRCAMPPPCKW